MTPEQAIYELVSLTATVPVIFANENGRRPEKPYIALRVAAAPRLPVHRGPVDTDGMQAVSSHRDAQVELQCFGAGSFDVLDSLGQRLHMNDAAQRAEVLDLAVFQVGEVRHAPVLRDATTYEPRAVLELGIRYTLTLADDVGLIETVNAEGTTEGAALPGPTITIHASVEQTPAA
ncbi:LIC_12616 family protein [Cupriavidus respiraculi]|uniref:Phage neck terminator protein gp12-like domain-containing protein n=1 Tax=Cupriavidus respiraculi TaxID=195930 RepID=A0ABM8WZT1_9BURK|nr:hypothetical protein [Cupriavidus respiraculi]CAG9173084.1 hypothetical protein LMG21510_02152 [Cupriavidus respiraculi]